MQNIEKHNNENFETPRDPVVFQKPGFLVKCANFFTQVFNLKGFILTNFIFKPPKTISQKKKCLKLLINV